MSELFEYFAGGSQRIFSRAHLCHGHQSRCNFKIHAFDRQFHAGNMQLSPGAFINSIMVRKYAQRNWKQTCVEPVAIASRMHNLAIDLHLFCDKGARRGRDIITQFFNSKLVRYIYVATIDVWVFNMSFVGIDT